MSIHWINSSPEKGPAPAIVGIDLGTTNSLVAYVRHGNPVVLGSREGGHLLPSVVSLESGQPIVGYAAKKHKIRDAALTAFSVKRLLGREYKDLELIAPSLPFKILPGDGPAKIQLGDRSFSVIEISAMILRELKLAAEADLKIPVSRAVITVPAYFNDSQRQATRAAGRLAGLDVLRIINEPTAAALAYGIDRKRNGLIAVYDLGGGTFDISILKLSDGIFEVLATNGNTALGGDDLDMALVNSAIADIGESLINDDIQLRAALIEAAETVKIALSEEEEAVFEVTIAKYKYQYHRPWTRDEFEALVTPILEGTRAPCLQALKDAGLTPNDLSDVILVGGPTRLGVVRRLVKNIFGREPNISVDPDEVVALGAAIQADILAGNNRDLLLLDVVPLSLGIETYGRLMSPLISRNTRIPTVARETFTTFANNQTAVDIHVLQGERDNVADNRSLARFKLGQLKPMPAGAPRIEVTFLVDADGILQVSAKDIHTGLAQSIEVRPSYGLTETEIEAMLSASQEHAEEDVKFHDLVQARNEAEVLLRKCEEAEPANSRIKDAIHGLHQIINQTDSSATAIREAAHQLNQAYSLPNDEESNHADSNLSSDSKKL